MFTGDTSEALQLLQQSLTLTFFACRRSDARLPFWAGVLSCLLSIGVLARYVRTCTCWLASLCIKGSIG